MQVKNLKKKIYKVFLPTPQQGKFSPFYSKRRRCSLREPSFTRNKHLFFAFISSLFVFYLHQNLFVCVHHNVKMILPSVIGQRRLGCVGRGGVVGGCHRLYTYNTNRNTCQLLQDNNCNYNMTVIIKPSTDTDSGIYIYFSSYYY